MERQAAGRDVQVSVRPSPVDDARELHGLLGLVPPSWMGREHYPAAFAPWIAEKTGADSPEDEGGCA